MIPHHFTVDVEEYFQVSALEAHVARERWDMLESRVGSSVERLLGLLAQHQARATFFVLGWIAERHPHLIRLIVAAGHEIASHGWSHQRVTRLTPEEFRDSVRRSRQLLEDQAGVQVLGFRAPSYSIVPGREWALEILVEEGYRYDSSIFPIRRRGYGYPGALRDPHSLACRAGPLVIIPPATLRYCGVNLPAAGGAYFRLFPYALVRQALRDAERRGVPATFYVHPWEIDPDQPRFSVPWFTRIRHYGGLGRTFSRLSSLLREFQFDSISNSVDLSGPNLKTVPIPQSAISV